MMDLYHIAGIILPTNNVHCAEWADKVATAWENGKLSTIVMNQDVYAFVTIGEVHDNTIKK